MNPINSNIFIEPLPKEDTGFSVDVSENSLTRNWRGIIKMTQSYKNVTIGDEVCIPHYGVLDIEYNGIEYALTKHSKLFAKKKGETYIPINKYVKVRKCTNDHIRDEDGEIALYMSNNHVEDTNWVEIVDIADDCVYMNKGYVGMFCVSPEKDERLCRIGYTKEFCLHEDLIKFVTNGE